jgi:hypothetical protein
MTTTLGIILRAMRRALQWRLLLLSPIALLVASLTTLFALSQFFGELFGNSPRWKELTSLDSSAAAGVIKALGTSAADGIPMAIETSLILALVFAPLLAGAALTVAEPAGAPARPRLRELLAGAGSYYPRLLRMQIAALVPLGLAGIVISVVNKWASRVSDAAASETATHTSGRIALVVSIVLLFLAQLIVDAGRARLAAEPARRSAVRALWAGFKLIRNRPLHALSLGAVTMIVGLLAAAVLLVVRQQITQGSTMAILAAFVIGQLAVAAVAWGRAAKLCGLVEIARDLAASSTTIPVAEARPAPADPVPAE